MGAGTGAEGVGARARFLGAEIVGTAFAGGDTVRA